MDKNMAVPCVRHQINSFMLIMMTVSTSIVMIAFGITPDAIESKNFFLDLSFDVVVGNGSTNASLSGDYLTQLTPENWTIYSVWMAVYLFEAVWILYAFISSMVHFYNFSSSAFVSPCILTSLLFVTFVTKLCTTIIWLMIWPGYFFLCMILIMVLMVGPGGMMADYFCRVRGLVKCPCDHLLEETGTPFMVTFTRIFVSNGVGTYCTWTVLSYLGVLGRVLALFTEDPNAPVTCYLTLVFFVLLAFAMLDLLMLEVTRFTFSPYLIVLWVLFLMADNWDLKPDLKSSGYVWALTGMSDMVVMMKVMGSLCQPLIRRKSMYDDDDIKNLKKYDTELDFSIKWKATLA